MISRQAYKSPGGTVCVPPGTYLSLPTGVLPQPILLFHNIIIGIGEFGNQVLRVFKQMNTVYRTGFNWEKTQLICFGSEGRVTEEPSPIIPVKDSEGLRTILKQVAIDRNDNLRVILIADVTNKDDQKTVADLLINSYHWQTNWGVNLNWYLLLNIAPVDLITTRRQQAIFLRELDFWMQAGFHTPLPGQNREDKLINTAVVLNEVELSTEAIEQAALSLYSLFYAQSSPDSNTMSVKLRALGTPWLTLVQYFASKLAMEWLKGNVGIFPSYALTQVLVDNASQVDMRAAPNEVFLEWLQNTLNSREKLRWAAAYVAVYTKFGEKPLRSLSNFFLGKATFFQNLEVSLQARLTQAQTELKAFTQDMIMRWNVPENQAVPQADGLFTDLFTDNLKNSIFNSINTHVQVHCELKDNNLNIVPLCVPSIVPTTYDYHQFAYPFPDQLDFFVEELVKLFEDQITAHFEKLPPLPPIDTSYNPSYFDELAAIKHDSLSATYLVYSSNRNWPLTRSYSFPKTVNAKIVNINEPQLVIGMIQENGLSYQEFPYPNVYVSREDWHFDPHLKNAAFFESKEQSENPVPFHKELVMTLYDRNSVVLFWKAFDRGLVSWVDDVGWEFKLGIIHEALGKPSDDPLSNKRKTVASLWDAYENFAITKRANLTSSDQKSPFNNIAFIGTMEKLKNAVSATPINPDARQWFSEKMTNLHPGEPKNENYVDLYRLYRICRKISIQELTLP